MPRASQHTVLPPTPAPSSAFVRGMEERAFNAWPAHQTLVTQGWVLRLSGGFTKRANSVNPLAPEGDFEALRAEAAALYARQALPAIFRITPLAPSGADAALAAAGYAPFDPSLVLTRPLTAADAASMPLGDDMLLAPTAGTTWLDGFAAANGVVPHHRALHHTMVQAIAHPAVFATLQAQGQAVGFGLAVYERGMVGLFDIAIAPSQRGGGRGRLLVQSLLHWGARLGAHTAYLQVRAQNAPALALYEGLGFSEAYRYHYRMPPGH